MTQPPATRRVWVSADAHIGFVAGGRDGGDWLELAARDAVENMGPIDFALFLGDATHAFTAEQFERYMHIRRHSGIGHWYEIVGNHDFHGTESGDWQRIVGGPFRFTLIDGNVAWICFSAERGRAAGKVSPETRTWLAEQLARHQDKNVIVCSHQLVYDTIAGSEDMERFLHPDRAIRDLLDRFRVDLWLGGHLHGRPRTAEDAGRVDGTTFINVASVSHIYGTQAANSFLLLAEAGGTRMRARCRIHDEARYAENLEVTIPFPHPLRFGPLPADGLRMVP